MLSKVKIAARLLIGFGLMMLLIAGLGGYSLLSLDKIEGGYEGALRAQSNYTMDMRLLENLGTARASYWRYLATGEEGKFNDARASLDSADTILAELTNNTQDAGRKDKLRQLKDLFASYREKSARYKDIKNRQWSLDTPEAKEILTDVTSARKQIDTLGEELATSYKQSAKTREETAVSIIHDVTRYSTILGIVSLITGLLAAFVISRSISVPVKDLTGIMKKLANGDNAVEIPGLERRDEIGAMAQTVQVFKANAIEMDKMAETQRDMKKAAEAEKRRTMRAIADDFEREVRGVVDIVSAAATEMQSSAQGLAATAEQTSRQSVAVAAAVEQTSRNVQTVASATEELTASIGEIGSQMNRANVITNQGASDGDSTNAAMKRLAETAQKIGDIIGLIQDIAGQTNLLALNATIEAARAGDAGKGFAVVASEVKNLASQTGKATEDIEKQINTVQTETTSAVQAISKICGTLSEIRNVSAVIASSVEEQSSATKEIASNIQEAAQGTVEVAKNVEQLTQASKVTGTSAQEMFSAASDLAKQGEALRREVNRFLVRIHSLETGATAAVDTAKSDHVNFKNNIADVLAERKKMIAAKLSTHHTCRFGEWYDGVQDDIIKNDPVFVQLLEPHRQVHACGKEVLLFIEQGKRAEAASAFKRLEAASEQVLALADRLGRNVAEREQAELQAA